LITHWQQRLNLAETSTTDLIRQLRQHPEAGELLRVLEDWLHRPPGRAAIQIEDFLAPYARGASATPEKVPSP
jgi:hypothetical protein